VPASTEGLGGAALVGVVLQVVSDPTLVVARTGQCAGIVRVTRVGLIWDTRHGIWVGTGCTVCAKREGSWTYARASVRTYACACGPMIVHMTWRMGQHWTGELDRRGRRVH
jgi:hypothetical protein